MCIRDRDQPQAGDVLDRLVGRAVLAQTHRVVGPHEDHRDPLQRRQPDRRTHVVGEGEERAAVRPGQPLQGDPVQDHAHRVLADPEVQGAAVGIALPHGGLVLGRDEARLALHRRVVGLGLSLIHI